LSGKSSVSGFIIKKKATENFSGFFFNIRFLSA